MKQFFKELWVFIKEKFLKPIKNYLSVPLYAVIFGFSIVAIVFLCMYNVADWCITVGLGCTSVALFLFAIAQTIANMVFVKLINQGKKELLESLANETGEQDYLKLETPFKEEDENYIQSHIKKRSIVVVLLWLLAILVFATFILQFTIV